jgi:hypothetical protein
LRQQVAQLIVLLQQRRHLLLQAVALIQLECCFEIQLAKLSGQLEPANTGTQN